MPTILKPLPGSAILAIQGMEIYIYIYILINEEAESGLEVNSVNHKASAVSLMIRYPGTHASVSIRVGDGVGLPKAPTKQLQRKLVQLYFETHK